MILLISSALMSISLPWASPAGPPTRSLARPSSVIRSVARSLCSLAVTIRRAVRRLPSVASPDLLASVDQRLFHFLQLSRHAAVVHRAPETRHDATDDGRIDAGLEDDGASGGVLQRLLERAELLGRQRRRRGHLAAHDLLVVHHACAERARDVRQQ